MLVADCARRPLTRPDHGFLARLLPVKEDDPPEKKARVAAANSTALRRHFGDLSTAFLAPFEPFISPQLPPDGDHPVPPAGPSLAPAFSHTAFLEALPVRRCFCETFNLTSSLTVSS